MGEHCHGTMASGFRYALSARLWMVYPWCFWSCLALEKWNWSPFFKHLACVWGGYKSIGNHLRLCSQQCSNIDQYSWGTTYTYFIARWLSIRVFLMYYVIFIYILYSFGVVCVLLCYSCVLQLLRHALLWLLCMQHLVVGCKDFCVFVTR